MVSRRGVCLNMMGLALAWRLWVCGYPFCHQSCARNYFAVVWDLSDTTTMTIKMGLN